MFQKIKRLGALFISGMVITGVADRVPEKIKKLIYVAAVLPLNRESMFDAVGPEISSFLFNGAQENNGWQVPVGTPQGYGINNPEKIKWFNEMSTLLVDIFRKIAPLDRPSK